MPQRQKLPVEEKVRIIVKCLSEEISIGAGAKEVGVAPAILRHWIGIYGTEGEEGFLYKHNVAYSAQTKTAAVIDYRKGLGSLQTICKKYRIRGTRTLRNWIKVYNAHGDFNSAKH